jgi:hypothetical protein
MANYSDQNYAALNTVDATPTNLTNVVLPTASTAARVTAHVTALDSLTMDAKTFTVTGLAKKNGGAVTIVGASADAAGDSVSWSVGLAGVSDNVMVVVIGEAARTVQWAATVSLTGVTGD